MVLKVRSKRKQHARGARPEGLLVCASGTPGTGQQGTDHQKIVSLWLSSAAEHTHLPLSSRHAVARATERDVGNLVNLAAAAVDSPSPNEALSARAGQEQYENWSVVSVLQVS